MSNRINKNTNIIITNKNTNKTITVRVDELNPSLSTIAIKTDNKSMDSLKRFITSGEDENSFSIDYKNKNDSEVTLQNLTLCRFIDGGVVLNINLTSLQKSKTV